MAREKWTHSIVDYDVVRKVKNIYGFLKIGKATNFGSCYIIMTK